MPAEITNVLRRMAVSGELSEDSAALAQGQLLTLRARLFPSVPLTPRVGELRENVTAHDAWSIALAERLDAPLATLDLGLSRAPGARCRFVTPPGDI